MITAIGEAGVWLPSIPTQCLARSLPGLVLTGGDGVGLTPKVRPSAFTALATSFGLIQPRDSLRTQTTNRLFPSKSIGVLFPLALGFRFHGLAPLRGNRVDCRQSPRVRCRRAGGADSAQPTVAMRRAQFAFRSGALEYRQPLAPSRRGFSISPGNLFELFPMRPDLHHRLRIAVQKAASAA